MSTKRQYYGLDILKFILAVLVAMRHMIQVFFTAESRAHVWIGAWLSNLAVPSFFIMSGFFLFRKIDRETDSRGVIAGYSRRVIRLYLIWSAVYLPIDWYNWYHGDRDVANGILGYLHAFFFSSSIVQLWYLPALVVACLLVWLCYSKGMKIRYILLLAAMFFLVGYVGDNWYWNQLLPAKGYELLLLHNRIFLTMRNGLYYGMFYVAMGLGFAKCRWRLPVWLAGIGSVLFIWLMYQEVTHFYNVNLVLSAVPAVYCLFTFATSLNLAERRCYARLRGMNEWIYLSHFYFFYFFAWTLPFNPVPANNKTITLMIMIPLVFFSWLMVRLSETERGKCLKKLI